ncbi:hypothetical protein B0H63DRAFT_477321 [Podospora didyma]|uniref:Uncharacterized protein n=1 Tax=Podospora didyma TaxID=330526 RepID=A0AAE0NB58_9PEZI|nr:hypothetical protein B0H63DRAFT_477321 [Podospora didyma]
MAGYYSPGVCISGYTLGCTATAGETPGAFDEGWTWAAISAGETAVWCVLRHYEGYRSHIFGEEFFVSATNGETVEPALQIRWQSSDLPLLEAATASASAAATTTSPTPAGITSSPTLPTAATSNTNQTRSGGSSNCLSVGSIVAVAIGAVAVVLLS